MSEEDFPQVPNWEELEKDPKFQEELAFQLGCVLESKKFGTKFLNTHDEMSERRAMEDEHGEVKEPANMLERFRASSEGYNNPLLSEVGALRKDLELVATADDVMVLANKYNIEFTDEEIAEAKSEALLWYLNI